MDVTLKSWDGNSINNGTAYVSKIWRADDPMMARSSPVYSSQIGAPPMYTTKEMTSTILPITITVAGTAASLTSDLFKWFDSSYDGEKVLVGTDSASKDWYINATPIGVVERISGSAYKVALNVGDYVWQSVTTYGTAGTITTTAGTVNVVTAGNMYSKPDIKLVPTAGTVAGFSYSMFVPVHYDPNNTTFYLYGAIAPVDIFNAAFPGSALVAAGRAQATGNDVRIYVNDVEVPRFLNNWNTGSAQAFVTMDMGLYNYSSASGTTYPYNVLSGSLSAIATVINFSRSWTIIPAGKQAYFQNGNEIIQGTLSTGGVSGSIVNVISRALFNTVAGTLATGGTIYPLNNKVMMYYGNSTMAAPTLGSADYPMFDYTTSNNAKWVYSQFQSTAYPTRPAQWNTNTVYSGWHLYSGTGDTTTDPAEVMGIRCDSATAVTTANMYRFPQGLNPSQLGTVVYSGYKYRSGTGWFLNTTSDGALLNFGTSYGYITTPTTAGTWYAHDGTITSTENLPYFDFIAKRQSSSVNGIGVELGAATITFKNTPVVGTSPALSIFTFSGSLGNANTGDSLYLTNNQVLNGTVDINTDAHTLYYTTGGSVNLFPSTTFSSYRQEWLKMNPGTTAITWTQPGTVNTIASITWKDRQS
jgi:hypothetical protein